MSKTHKSAFPKEIFIFCSAIHEYFLFSDMKVYTNASNNIFVE